MKNVSFILWKKLNRLLANQYHRQRKPSLTAIYDRACVLSPSSPSLLCFMRARSTSSHFTYYAFLFTFLFVLSFFL